VVDSFDEVDRLEAQHDEDGIVARALVRVTPGVEAHTHEYVMTGQVDSKFGFGLSSGDAAEAVARVAKSPAVELVGVHAHIGSQIFVVRSFEKAVAALADFVRPLDLDELCLGGGLGVPYVEGETAPTLTEWAAALHGACRAARIRAATRITVEPGRAIVAAAGVTLYRVGTIKEIPGIRTYVSVDGGMSDNIRTALYDADYSATLASRSSDAEPVLSRVVGKHCEAGDIVVKDVFLPADARPGDLLAVPATGAYCRSMASNYNHALRPPVVAVADGTARVVVRRETEDDLLATDVGAHVGA
jgi:diaminopimelate decarboxylase